jgi:hypothetical protein
MLVLVLHPRHILSTMKYQASHALEELLPQEGVIPVLLPRAREHLARIRTDILE